MAGPILLLPAAAARVDDVVVAIGGQSSARWAAPSPCARWTVRDVLNHLTSEHLWAPHLLQGQTLTQVGDQYDGDVLGADPAGSWQAAIAASLMAWADLDDPARPVHTSMGPIPAHEYAHQMLVDLVVHGWDMARGAGVPYEPHDESVAACLAYEEPRVGTAGIPGIFAPAVEAASDRPLDRLLALLGRSTT